MPSQNLSRRLSALLLLWAFAATIWRALRPPNDFALAHWLLDYRLGFIKRGLVGSLATAASGGRPAEGALAAAAFVVFAASSAALLYALWQLAARGRGVGTLLLALALAGSPLVVMHAHLVGYLDGVVIALTVLAVALALRDRARAGAVVLALAVLVHENVLLTGVPAFLFAVHRRGGERRRATSSLLAPVLAVFALLALAQALQPQAALRTAIATRLAPVAWLDPVIRDSLPVWLTDSFVENFRQCADGLWQRSMWAVAPLLVAPTLLAALWQAWPGLRSRRDRAAFIAVCALPQLTHLFAWDGPRLWTWSLLAALLAAWVTAATTAPSAGPPRRLERPALTAFVLLILGNLWFTIPLMDSEADHLPRLARLLLHLPVLAAAAILVVRRPQPAWLAGPRNPD